jgi:hypothetical protein
MLAHLAGALNLPAWLLLKHDADWRWGHNTSTPWYPSLRLLRQSSPGDWRPVIAELANALAGQENEARPRLRPAPVTRERASHDGA